MDIVATPVKKRDANRQERLKRILKAGEQEFALKGFRGATVQGIADLAELPKPNVLYYFANKQAIYDAVLTNILELWNQELVAPSLHDDPAQSLERYIRSKVEISRKYPTACRIFASEVIHGGAMLSDSMKTISQEWVRKITATFEQWIKDGRMLPVSPAHLLFLIWGSTQHYADYESQICSIMGKKRLDQEDYQQAADNLCQIILRGCGLQPPA